MNRIRKLPFIAVALALTILAGCDDRKESADKKASAKLESGEIHLSDAQIELAEIKTAPASIGSVDIFLRLPGEVKLDQNRVAHVIARAAGFVQEARSNLGDSVRAGDVMAVIDSRELGEASAAYLAARERYTLAQELFAREERLWKQKVSAEQEYLTSRRALAEAQIELRTARQALRALGFSDDYITGLERAGVDPATRYELVAPFNGSVIERSIVRGQSVDGEAIAYVVADLTRLWVIASVYERDISRIQTGQSASVAVRGPHERAFPGSVAQVADTIDEKSRTMKIRLDVDNRDSRLKPGMFVNVDLAVDGKEGVLVIPSGAVQEQKDESFVFVAEGGGKFVRRDIKTGLRSRTSIEVLDGLRAGEAVVVEGASTLKAELNKESLGGSDAH